MRNWKLGCDANFANFVHFCITHGNCYHIWAKDGNDFCLQYKSIQNLQGCISAYYTTLKNPSKLCHCILVLAKTFHWTVIIHSHVRAHKLKISRRFVIKIESCVLLYLSDITQDSSPLMSNVVEQIAKLIGEPRNYGTSLLIVHEITLKQH